MKIILTAIINILHLAVPYLILLSFMMIDFLLNGSGNGASINYEKYQWYWIVAYLLLAIIHLAIAYKFWKQVNTKIKHIVLIFTIGIYIYFVLKF